MAAKKTQRTTLSIVQKHFPKVTKVIDAKQNLEIEVTAGDGNASKRRSHEECAMAKACKRAYHADGVIVSRTMAYLIKDTLAVRFTLPPSVTREIVAFDRGGSFGPGVYHLSVPSTSDRAEYYQKKNKARINKDGSTGQSTKRPNYHITQGIRSVLGGSDDKG